MVKFAMKKMEKATPWSAPAFWDMGLLEPSDWTTSWIEPGLQEDVTKTGPVPLLRLALLGIGVLGVAASGQVMSLGLRVILIGSAAILVCWARRPRTA